MEWITRILKNHQTDKAQRPGRRGFTLIELLVVMAIMIFLMSIIPANFYGLARGTRRRDAVGNLRAAMGQARQFAIIKRRTTSLEFKRTTNGTNDYYWIYYQIPGLPGEFAVGEKQYLPPGMMFVGATPPEIKFRPDGSVSVQGGGGPITIQLTEAENPTQKEGIEVNFLTGTTKYIPPS